MWKNSMGTPGARQQLVELIQFSHSEREIANKVDGMIGSCERRVRTIGAALSHPAPSGHLLSAFVPSALDLEPTGATALPREVRRG